MATDRPVSDLPPASGLGETFLKHIHGLAGYVINYESLSLDTEAETGIQNGAAIAGISRRSHSQMRLRQRAGSGGTGFETE